MGHNSRCNCPHRNRETKCIGCDLRWDSEEGKAGGKFQDYTFDLGERSAPYARLSAFSWAVPFELRGKYARVCVRDESGREFLNNTMLLGDSIVCYLEVYSKLLKCSVTIQENQMRK